MGKVRPAVLPLVAAVLLLLALVPSSGSADDLGPPPDWVGKLMVNAEVTTLSNPASTQEELPGLGHKFELLYTMIDDVDPENSTNDVISDLTAPGYPEGTAVAYRPTPPGVKIRAFTNQLGFKYYFVAPKTCQAGSPRIVLLVDANGDGAFTQPPDFAANGHIQPFTGCPQNEWFYENLTDNLPRWEATPFIPALGLPSFPYAQWDAFSTAVTTVFPNHKVLAGFLLDGESCAAGFGPNNCGKAYFDLVTIENRSIENDQDTVRKGN